MRKTIVLDEKDIKILADYRKKTKPIYKRLSIIGFVTMVAGGVVEVNGNPWGFLIMAVGIGLLIFGMIMSNKHFKKSKNDFMEYVNKYNEIPYWPEEKK